MIDEFTIQSEFVKWARKQDFIALCFAVPNGFTSNVKNAVMMKREGLLPGVPDVFCLLKSGIWAIIEFKTQTGKVSEKQQKIIDILKENNQHVIVCRSTFEAVKSIKLIVAKNQKRR